MRAAAQTGRGAGRRSCAWHSSNPATRCCRIFLRASSGSPLHMPTSHPLPFGWRRLQTCDTPKNAARSVLSARASLRHSLYSGRGLRVPLASTSTSSSSHSTGADRCAPPDACCSAVRDAAPYRSVGGAARKGLNCCAERYRCAARTADCDESGNGESNAAASVLADASDAADRGGCPIFNGVHVGIGLERKSCGSMSLRPKRRVSSA